MSTHTPGRYVNDWGVEVVGYMSAMGGLYKSERVALEISEGVGPCHAVVKFSDVFDAYEALEHILRYDSAGLGPIGEALARSALKNGRRAATGEQP